MKFVSLWALSARKFSFSRSYSIPAVAYVHLTLIETKDRVGDDDDDDISINFGNIYFIYP